MSRVWVYIPKSYKGLSKKLLHNYHGPYRVAERLSPVHFRLRTCSNRPVTSIVHANRMKPFIDPQDRPITPSVDVDDELYVADLDFPHDSFSPSAETTNAHNLTGSPNTDCLPIANPEAYATPTTETGRLRNSALDIASQALIDNDTVYHAERLLKSRDQTGKLSISSNGSDTQNRRLLGNHTLIFLIHD